MSLSERIIKSVERRALSKTEFILITNNCWGSDIYNTLGRPYNTPFVGLYVPGESYIALLSDFEKNISKELTFISKSPLMGKSFPFPIALLGEKIEIHFMHYASEEEAKTKWARRVTRLRKSLDEGAPLRVKFCDRDPGNARWIAQFHQLGFESQLSFGVKSLQIPSHLCVKADPSGDFVPVGPRLYRKRYRYFDFCEWLKSGRITKTQRSRLLSVLR